MVPQEYIDKWLSTVQSQIVLGGYRLAYVINFIFGSTTMTVPKGIGFDPNLAELLRKFTQ